MGTGREEMLPLVEMSDYIPFIDEDLSSDESELCSTSQVPKSSNSTTVLQKKVDNRDCAVKKVENQGVNCAANCDQNYEIFSENEESEYDLIPSRMASSTISSHSSLQRPGKDYGNKLSACPSQCQDDSSVVWLGRYPNSYIAGPIGSAAGAHPYPSAGYVLSDDFQQKQVEMLEKKYGGHYRAHRAAIVVQRAFRDFSLAQKWKQVCNPSRRRMQRIHASPLSPRLPAVNNNHASDRFVSPRGNYRYEATRTVRQEVTTTTVPARTPPGGKKERENGDLNDQQQHFSPTGLKLHRYNERPHLSAPLSAQLRAVNSAGQNGARKMSEHRNVVHVQAPQDNGNFQESTGRNVPAVRVIGKPRSVSAERHRNHRTQASTGRVRVIPIVSAHQNAGIRSRASAGILSHESEILRDACSPCQSPPTTGRFAETNSSSNGSFSPKCAGGHPRVLPSRPSDTSLLSQESQGSSNSGGSSSSGGLALVLNNHSVNGGAAAPLPAEAKNWSTAAGPAADTRSSDLLPSYLTYAEFREVTRSPRDLPRVKCQRTMAHLPISASTVLPANSGWTSGSELDTPSSDTGSGVSVGGAYAHYGSSEGIRSPRIAPIVVRRSPREVWIQRPEPAKLTGMTPSESRTHAPLHVAGSDSVLVSKGVNYKSPTTSVKSSIINEPELRRSGRSTASSRHHQSEVDRKRHYRIALNFFNKKPDRGMQFLIDFGFVDSDPCAVAKFLMSRRGLSKQMIGEYLGNLQNPFNASVLQYFVTEVDLRNLEVDMALRKFQAHFRFPGEAQKIERIIEVFSRRYCQCNPDYIRKFRQPDSVFILSFAVIMLNTDLHSPNIKSERRMKLVDFLKNLKGIDDGVDLDQRMLTGIYQRVKEEEFKPGTDHVTQVMKVDRSIVGKKPALSLPHRRLVCYCRLYEVEDPQKKQSSSVHQREIFLFNDILVITKILSRKKTGVTYSYRQSHSLVGMQVHPFRTQHFPHGLRIHHTLENKVIFFNARSEDDKAKFMDDLRESIMESDQMEALRIELELEKQSLIRPSLGRSDGQRDSGLPDIGDEGTLRKGNRALSNSLLELAGAVGDVSPEKPLRSGSLNSLDSGMSSTASVESRDMSPKDRAQKQQMQESREFGGSMFGLVGNDPDSNDSGTLKADEVNKKSRTFQKSSTNTDV